MPKRPRAAVLLTREMQERCFAPADLERIAAATDLAPAETDEMDPGAQLSAMRGAEIVVTGWGTAAITVEMLDAAPGLRLMCHSAGSIKHLVDVDEFARRGIRVTSAAPALALGVAEFAFGLMLVSMKAAWQCHALTLAGRWDRDAVMEWVREPFGATVGVIGASFVGRHLIALCRTLALGRILLYDPYVGDEEAAALGVERVELDELMRRSDVVQLCAPKTDETHHMIDADRLALLRDRAIFINTSRGALVDEAALIAELEKGRILACLDVTDPEPPSPESPLFRLPNCILTPHVAGAIKENVHRQGALVADEIEAFTAGKPLRNPVDLGRLHRMA